MSMVCICLLIQFALTKKCTVGKPGTSNTVLKLILLCCVVQRMSIVNCSGIEYAAAAVTYSAHVYYSETVITLTFVNVF